MQYENMAKETLVEKCYEKDGRIWNLQQRLEAQRGELGDYEDQVGIHERNADYWQNLYEQSLRTIKGLKGKVHDQGLSIEYREEDLTKYEKENAQLKQDLELALEDVEELKERLKNYIDI